MRKEVLTSHEVTCPRWGRGGVKDTGAIIINELRCRLKPEASYSVSGADDVCRRVVTCNSRADNLMNGQ